MAAPFLFLLTAIAFAVPARADSSSATQTRLSPVATTSPSTCTLPTDKFRDITDTQIDQFCFDPIKALTPVRNPGARMAAVRLCRNAFLQTRESAKVTFATNGRKSSFNPEIAGTLDQKTAPEKAAQLLLDSHTFTNVSLAALYRSRLKLHKAVGQSKRGLDDLQTEMTTSISNHDRTVQSEQAARSQGLSVADQIRDVSIPAYAKDQQAIQESQRTLKAALDCAEKMLPPLDNEFSEWVKVKKGLLAQDFRKLFDKSSADADRAGAEAASLQAGQQSVYDNLTDPDKRSTAYRVAEACDDFSCNSWAGAASTVARTPVLAILTKGVTGSIAYTKASGQGLGFWDSIRETGNALTPMGIEVLDTEVGAIEKGSVRPFNSPL
ncbi:MAG: hypothetical protein ACXVB9_04135 [Bdellovibrionota bacterium]